MSLPRSFTAEQLEMARQLRAEQAAAGSFHSGRQGNVPRRGQRSGHRGPTTRSWGTHSFQQGRAAFATPCSSRSSFNASNGRCPFASGLPVNSQPTGELVRFGGNVSTPTTGQFVNSSSAGASSSSPPIEPETVSTQENDGPDYPLPLLDTDIDPGCTAPTLIPTAVNTPGNTPGNTQRQVDVPSSDSPDMWVFDSIPAQAESHVKAPISVRPAQGLSSSRWAS